MTFETLATEYIGCKEARLPRTHDLVSELGRAGLSLDELPDHQFLLIADFALKEGFRRHIVRESDVIKIYSRIHDEIVAPTLSAA